MRMHPGNIVLSQKCDGASQDANTAMDCCWKMQCSGDVFLLVPPTKLIGACPHAAHAWSSALQHNSYLYVYRMSLPLHRLQEVLDLLDPIALYKTWNYSGGNLSETSQRTVC